MCQDLCVTRFAPSAQVLLWAKASRLLTHPALPLMDAQGERGPALAHIDGAGQQRPRA